MWTRNRSNLPAPQVKKKNCLYNLNPRSVLKSSLEVVSVVKGVKKLLSDRLRVQQGHWQFHSITHWGAVSGLNGELVISECKQSLIKSLKVSISTAIVTEELIQKAAYPKIIYNAGWIYITPQTNGTLPSLCSTLSLWAFFSKDWHLQDICSN